MGEIVDTKHDLAKVPPYDGRDPTPPLEVEKPLGSRPMMRIGTNKGRQGAQKCGTTWRLPHSFPLCGPWSSSHIGPRCHSKQALEGITFWGAGSRLTTPKLLFRAHEKVTILEVVLLGAI